MVVRIDLNRPMDEIRAELSRYPVKTRLSLTGPMVVARDIAHAKIKERLDAGEPMPQYLRDHCVYYAGPAKTPEGIRRRARSAPPPPGRMDAYVDEFQAAGGSLVMLAKGNRSRRVTDACQAHGGFYLGSIGGPAARLAQDCIRKVEVLEYPELGMEAVWRIEVEDFPAFIVVDDKGNDFLGGPPVNRLRGGSAGSSGPLTRGQGELALPAMKFGLAFANTGPFATPGGAAAVGEAAEEAGFDSLWTVEHVVVPNQYASTYPYSPTGKMPGAEVFDIPDPLIWLACVAARTTTLRLATGILILPQRNPLVTAKEVATLDKLSGGRMILGVGIGWLEEEFRFLGADFANRGARTEEYIEAMRARCGADELPSFEGETVQFTEAISLPARGGVGPRRHRGPHAGSARRAGRVGDGYFPGKGDLPVLLDEMRKAAEEAGRDPEAIEVTASGADVLAGGQQAVDAIGQLTELGVSRVAIPPLTYDVTAIGDVLGRFGDDVIAQS